MNRIKAIGIEILGLFVEDARLSAVLVVWIAVAAATRPWWLPTPRLAAITLFVGLAAILAENVLRAARRE